MYIIQVLVYRVAGQFLPEHIGIPMGGNRGSKYYMMEIHYDNPNAKQSEY